MKWYYNVYTTETICGNRIEPHLRSEAFSNQLGYQGFTSVVNAIFNLWKYLFHRARHILTSTLVSCHCLYIFFSLDGALVPLTLHCAGYTLVQCWINVFVVLPAMSHHFLYLTAVNQTKSSWGINPSSATASIPVFNLSEKCALNLRKCHILGFKLYTHNQVLPT